MIGSRKLAPGWDVRLAHLYTKTHYYLPAAARPRYCSILLVLVVLKIRVYWVRQLFQKLVHFIAQFQKSQFWIDINSTLMKKDVKFRDAVKSTIAEMHFFQKPNYGVKVWFWSLAPNICNCPLWNNWLNPLIFFFFRGIIHKLPSSITTVCLLFFRGRNDVTGTKNGVPREQLHYTSGFSEMQQDCLRPQISLHMLPILPQSNFPNINRDYAINGIERN